MNNKIKLTETQFNKLNKFINEDKLQNILNGKVEVDDVIVIKYGGAEHVNEFKVKKIWSGNKGIVMVPLTDSIIKNFIYYMGSNALNDSGKDGDSNDLTVRRVHKDKIESKTNPGLWEQHSVKDVISIDILRNGKIIQQVDDPTPSDAKVEKNRKKGKKNAKLSDEFKAGMNLNIASLLKIKEDEGLTIKTKLGVMYEFCVVSNDGQGNIIIKTDENVGNINTVTDYVITLNKDGVSNFNSLFDLNKKTINSTDGGDTFDLLIDTSNNMKSGGQWINGIEYMDKTAMCGEGPADGKESADDKESEEKTDDEPIDTEKPEDYTKEEVLKAAKDAYNEIKNSQRLKDAFYTQPSFYKLFKAELTGKKAVGKGIISVLRLINNYQEQNTAKFSGKFKNNESVSFTIPNEMTGKKEKEFLESQDLLDKEIIGKVSIRKTKTGGAGYVHIKHSISESYYISFRLKEEIDDDTFLATFIARDKHTKEDRNKFNTQIKIKINPSDGYDSTI